MQNKTTFSNPYLFNSSHNKNKIELLKTISLQFPILILEQFEN